MKRRFSDKEIVEPESWQGAGIPGDEEAAKDYLISTGILRGLSCCPACGRTGIRQIRRNQCRCRDCRHEWGLRQDSILAGTRISFLTFIRLVRLFADNIPANEAARRLGIAYNTVYDIYRRIRSAVLADHSSADTPAKKIPGPAAPGCSIPATGIINGKKQVVFGIRLNNGRVTIDEADVPDPAIITALPVPTMQRGNILFIDAYGKKYQGFITYAPDRHGKDILRIRAPDGLPWSPLGDFWVFAGRTWMSHRGLEREQIPEFVQELAFRYNCRDTDIFQEILRKVAKSCVRL
jgi:transposase